MSGRLAEPDARWQPARRTRVARGAALGGTWELATRPVAPQLSPFVRAISGYTEHTRDALRRLEFPTPFAVVILEFGPPLKLRDAAGRDVTAGPGGFLAGLDEHATSTEHAGHQRGIQVNLTPTGARALFGVPMSELTGRVVALRDVLPRAERGLAAALAELPDWDTRFDRLERFLARRLDPALADAPRDVVAWAVQRIEACGGRIELRALAGELGYSAKHVITLFRDRVGVTPRQLARLVRFHRLVARLRAGPPPREWAALALELGYYDQSHLIREVRAFAGVTPTALLAMQQGFGAG